MISLQAPPLPKRVNHLARPPGEGEAWDLVGDAIGSRQMLDERFLSDDPIRSMALRYVSDDKAAVMNKVKAFLERY